MKRFLLMPTLFQELVQNRGERKHWRIKLWQIGYQPPNPPKFSPANVLCYTVASATYQEISAQSFVIT